MSRKWVEEYKKIWEKDVFVSKLSSFVISIFTLLSFYDFARFFYLSPDKFNWHFIQEIELVTPIIFQFIILTVFLTRFAYLLLNRANAFYISHALSVAGLFVFFVYWYYSIPEPSTVSFETYHPGPVFKHSSQFLSFLGVMYLILSPIRLLVTLIVSLIRVGKNKK